MTQFIAVENSNIYDICLNTYGSFNFLVKLMDDNNFPGVNYYPIAGEVFLFDETLVLDQNINRTANNQNIKYATRYRKETNESNMVKYEKVIEEEYTAGADGEVTISLPALAGARIVSIEREIRPLNKADYSFNNSSCILTLLNGHELAADEKLSILYAILVTS